MLFSSLSTSNQSTYPNSLIPSSKISQATLYDSLATDDSNNDSECPGRIKKLKCSFPGCKMRFMYPSLLHRHETTHEKERPFMCSYEGCSKSFKRADVLKNHIRLHTKETPFVCPKQGCESSFANKAALKYHITKHGCQEIYKCRVPRCKKSYSTMENLRKHEKRCLENLTMELNQSSDILEAKIYSELPKNSNLEQPCLRNNENHERMILQNERTQQGINESDFITYSPKASELEQRAADRIWSDYELDEKVLGEKFEREPFNWADEYDDSLFGQNEFNSNLEYLN